MRAGEGSASGSVILAPFAALESGYADRRLCALAGMRSARTGVPDRNTRSKLT